MTFDKKEAKAVGSVDRWTPEGQCCDEWRMGGIPMVTLSSKEP